MFRLPIPKKMNQQQLKQIKHAIYVKTLILYRQNIVSNNNIF